MQDRHQLMKKLERLDGRGYKAYRDIEGSYDMGDFVLIIDHVQGDPFASPSRVRARIKKEEAGFEKDLYKGKSRSKAFRDLLTREFGRCAGRYSGKAKGTGKSGMISIDRPGQEVLDRSSMILTADHIEARFFVGLPAFGRRIAGKQAKYMMEKDIPAIVDSSMKAVNLDLEILREHVEIVEDADHLRDSIGSMGLISFVADDSILPRRSGIDQRPMTGNSVVPFVSPDTLRVEVALPNRGAVTGMGIREGVTLIVGGGYHGKSTLLSAIERGVYDHIPGDGRELVVTDPSAVKIRAEDGRRIESVDISPFIKDLPFGADTTDFSSENGSGSTSQAANIMEALETGAHTLLIDEDTSATNFMIRDHRMQLLVSKEREPITPFIDKVRQLHSDLGVSSILVMGGSGDYFDAADRVICMEDYLPMDRTEEAISIARENPTSRNEEGGENFGTLTERAPVKGSLDPSRGKRSVKVQAKGRGSILFGTEMIDISYLEQLVDISQTRAIGDALVLARRYMDGNLTVAEIIERIKKMIDENGPDVLSPFPNGSYAEFRKHELAGALNRLRTLKVNQVER